jgi:hypothetical protein
VGEHEDALLRPQEEKRGEPKSLEPSGSRSAQSRDRVGAKQTASPVRAAHVEIMASLADHPPPTIPIDADAIDIEDRANHLDQVFRAMSAYVAVILDDTSQNVPGGLDVRGAEGLLADLASDLTGTIQRAADSMAEWLA